jgi:phosphoglycolate phosphatase-like HAD superfamily hydrolase
VPVATAVAVDLDGALGDTRPLWDAWLEDAARRLRAPELVELPADRGAAAAELDRRVGNWPALLERFCEDHAPVYLRPDPAANAALRRLHASGILLAVFTDAPEPLARVAAKHLGIWRILDRLTFGADSVERARFDPETQVVRTRDELLAATP